MSERRSSQSRSAPVRVGSPARTQFPTSASVRGPHRATTGNGWLTTQPSAASKMVMPLAPASSPRRCLRRKLPGEWNTRTRSGSLSSPSRPCAKKPRPSEDHATSGRPCFANHARSSSPVTTVSGQYGSLALAREKCGLDAAGPARPARAAYSAACCRRAVVRLDAPQARIRPARISSSSASTSGPASSAGSSRWNIRISRQSVFSRASEPSIAAWIRSGPIDAPPGWSGAQ